MLKRLSPCTEERLPYYLARVREINALGDEAALIETDKMIWEMLKEYKSDDDDEYEDEEDYDVTDDTDTSTQVPYTFRSTQHEIDLLRSQIEAKEGESVRYSIQRLKFSMQHSKERYKQNPDKALLSAFEEVEREFEVLRKQGLAIWFEQRAKELLEHRLATAVSSASVLGHLNSLQDEAEQEMLLTEQLRETILVAKQRAAWYRAKKRLDEAEVAKAGRSYIRYDKMKAESKVMLMQDWATAFPGEKPPELPDI